MVIGLTRYSLERKSPEQKGLGESKIARILKNGSMLNSYGSPLIFAGEKYFFDIHGTHDDTRLSMKRLNADPKKQDETVYQVAQADTKQGFFPDMCSWLDQWFESDIPTEMKLLEQEPVITNGLLKPAYANYLMQYRKQINPGSDDFFLRYGCFGADVSSALLISNATKIEAFDCNSINLEAYKDCFEMSLDDLKDKIIEQYDETFASTLETRRAECFWITDEAFFDIPRELLILYELKALAATNIQACADGVSFDWAYPGEEIIEGRTLSFHQGWIPDALEDLEPCDCYMQKCSETASPGESMDLIMGQVQPGAPVILGHSLADISDDLNTVVDAAIADYEDYKLIDIPEIYQIKVAQDPVHEPGISAFIKNYGFRLCGYQEAN